MENLNIAKALQFTKEMLTQMLAQGLGDSKDVFALSNVLCSRFSFTQDQSMVIIDEALKLV